jgi:16S rRNA processing protein RimM
MTTPANDTWIDIGRVGRAHGVHGWVHVRLFNPDSDLLEPGRQLLARQQGRPGRPLVIAEARGELVRFEGVEERTAASALSLSILAMPASDLPELEDDEFYLHEAVGAQVLDADSGAPVGVVTGIVSTQQDMLEVRLTAGGTALVPVESDAVVSLGREPGRVVVRHIDDWRCD